MVSSLDRAASALARHSVKVMLANQAPTGAFVASPNFAVYRYSWLRDGAFIADALSAAGEEASALAFLDWCRRLVEARRERVEQLLQRQASGGEIALAEFLHTRYTIDGRDGDEDWWNHQLDGYGAWLWALGAHVARNRLNSEGRRFAPAVETTARYLLAFWEHSCFDCWEENPEQVHVATLAAISAGLRVAAEWPGVASSVQAQAVDTLAVIERRVRTQGVRDGHLVKWLGGNELDASLLLCAVPYGLFEPQDPLMRATVDALSAVGLAHRGVHRHRDDVFFGGGEWILLAACLGSYSMSVGDVAGARAQLEWVVAQADDAGHLPEQVSQHLLHPECYQEWVERWGQVARPLLWSHAMLLNLHRELDASG